MIVSGLLLLVVAFVLARLDLPEGFGIILVGAGLLALIHGLTHTVATPMNLWRQYLFKSHPESILAAWAKRLRLFRFCRAWGGQANDGDSLVVVFGYSSTEDLLEIFRFAGVDLTIYDSCPPQPEIGKSYPLAELDKFPALISETTWIEQPGHCRIANQEVFVWCELGRIKISRASGYFVTEADVEAAEILENLFTSFPWKPIDPPIDNEHCICPKYYPEYFR